MCIIEESFNAFKSSPYLHHYGLNALASLLHQHVCLLHSSGVAELSKHCPPHKKNAKHCFK